MPKGPLSPHSFSEQFCLCLLVGYNKEIFYILGMGLVGGELVADN